MLPTSCQQCVIHQPSWTLQCTHKCLLKLTGVITVRSGKWLPPAPGWLHKMTSPSINPSPWRPIWYWTVSCIAPKCTGIWGALATRPPLGPNKAQEKSRRSYSMIKKKEHWSIQWTEWSMDTSRTLILVEIEVLCNTLMKQKKPTITTQDKLNILMYMYYTVVTFTI